ncbi:MAG: hypothetical protein IH594_18825, partial [Bacteroidales bacterium]|nr:hypothetical protein [Bacteroidales bacterium]
YDLSGDKLFDWGASFEGRANLGQGSNLALIEGYGKVRLGIFELRAGRSKKITGLCDTTLTSGSWAISGTSLGIPEIELSVRDFWTLPWFGELVAFKGNFSHGFFGEVASRRSRAVGGDTVNLTSYMHQKSFYIRLGKPDWNVKVYGGFNHQAIWGNEQDFYVEDYTLSPLQTYLYVVAGKKYSNGYIQSERLGNHLGSVDIGLEYTFKKVKIFLYRQSLYETGALANLANIQDGLNGFSLVNLQPGEKTTMWRALNIELLYTRNQAGRPWSPPTTSLYEGYYNHGQYLKGWSYLDIGLGNPFISTRAYIRESLPAAPEQYFINNRVIVLNLGFEGILDGINYMIRVAGSKNYGTYWTTDESQSTNILNPGEYGVFGEQNQLSASLEMSKRFPNNLDFGFIGTLDYGTLLLNSFGLLLKAAYSFNLR